MSPLLSKGSTRLVSKEKISQGLSSALLSLLRDACAFVQTTLSPSPCKFPKETAALGSLCLISFADTDLTTIWP